MTDKLELAVGVFRDNAEQFLSSISRTGPTGSAPVTCGATEGDLSLTPFHLNPFEQTPCAGVDWIVIAMLAVIIHAISWLPRYFVYEPLASARMTGCKGWNKDEAKRFSQNATSLLFFCSSAFCVYRILSSEDWLYSTAGWFSMSYVFNVKPDFKFYYLVYVARFASDLVSIFFEKRETDAFIASFIHHLITIGLVLGSAWVGHVGFGGIIMFFFDWADIPLLSAKLFKYLSKDPKDSFQFTANRLFELFAVTFFATRNCFYSFVVYRVLVDLSSSAADVCCKVLVVALVGLQTYWLYLIVMVVKRQQKQGGNVNDVREKDQ